VAVLSEADRSALHAEFMRVAQNILALGITKAELRAALNAADDWADANAASFNIAIPQPARNAMTAKQKTLLLSYVILKRANLL
jgi:hypothetical protein